MSALTPAQADQVKDLVREMLESEEGAIRVQHAILHPKGYGPALDAWLRANFVMKFMTALRGGAKKMAAPMKGGPALDQRGPRESWPDEFKN